MDKDEAERIASAIRATGALFTVLGVEMNPSTGTYEVKAEYHGKTKRLGNRQLEGCITLWVKTPAAWASIQATALNGIEVEQW